MPISVPVRIAAAGVIAGAALALPRARHVPAPSGELTIIAPAHAAAPAPRPASDVLPGLEVLLRDSLHLVRGKRVGLITNHTAVTHDGRSAIDLLHQHPDVRLVALFGPEHGIRGTVDGGAHISTQRDARTGLTVYSLYGATQRPTPAMLRGIDVLLFDMQDIGARPYTYVWTMTMAMEEAARAGIPFIVLDRPNPVTAKVEGPLMQFEMRNRGPLITGHYPVPLRHGLTAGELARYVNGEYRLGTRLTVIPAQGWRGDEWFDETHLPWINPSPNIRSLDAALSFSGLVMLETTNLSIGRGTDAPFSYVGAPYLDNVELLRRVRRYGLPGVEFELAEFTPRGTDWMQFRNQRCRAVRLRITDRDAYQPVLTALVFLSEIQKMHPRNLGMGPMLQMLGSAWAPAAVRRGDDPREIYRRWETENAAWKQTIAKYRLYPAE
ncbi:DUF1343 domain-containing protein [Longimicrobium sp.]|uniref:exo-beta-N-acetylmuramidase NamZ family protein n=1 Tax=Longimicrobium sp. TaxID=2029185 RepID=UPI002E31935A|nr:DUF1343 domain-containing protein [Longimicrobium sp.]HEX6040054.1 DUF1343 domain-containing protein [Longimicrobium sp.]